MNVCLLSMKRNFENPAGKGTQRYIYELWKNLPSMAKSHGINVERVDPGIGRSDTHSKVSFTLSIPLINLSKYDIIHIPAPIMFAPPLKGKAAIVTTAHEFVDLGEDSSMGESYARASRKERTDTPVIGDIIIKSAINQALASDYLIATSTLVKGEAIKKGFDGKRIYIANLGLDDRFRSPVSMRSHKKFTVGYLGGLNHRKNVKFAINAFIKTGSKDLEFKVYGSGFEQADLMKQASSDRRISFKGFAPEDSLTSIYDSFDAFIFPSVYEGFGLPMLEAQARGLPVIILSGSKMPKEVRKYCIAAKGEGDAAQIIEDLRRNGYNTKTRKKAMEYARSFTWRKCADDTIKAYEDISRKR